MIMTSLCLSAYGLKPHAALSNTQIEEPQKVTISTDSGDSLQYNQSVFQRIDELEKKVEENQYQNGLMVNSINNILIYSVLFFSVFLTIIMLTLFLFFIIRNRKKSDTLYENAMNGYFSSTENQAYLFKSMFTLLLEQNQKIANLYLESKARYPVISAAYDSDQNPFPKKPNLEDAMSDYDRAIEIDPKKTKAYLERGMLKKQLGDISGAMSDFDKAIELDSGNPRAYLERGMILKESGKTFDAMKDFEKAIELDPNNSKGYLEYAILAFELGQVEGALESLDKAIYFDPSNPKAYEIRSRIKQSLGDFESAMKDLNISMKLLRDNAEKAHNDY